MLKRFITICVVCFALVGTGFAVLNRQYIRDWYVVQTTDTQPAANALAGQLTLTASGHFLYDASQPEVLEATAFNQACQNVTREQSVVLGCYSNQRIYIYNVTDTQLDGVTQVTAAHELLHAAYERLSFDKRQKLDAELTAVAKTITSPSFLNTIAEYKKTEPNDVNNELHSILGTEYANLSPVLEAHYRQYFADRQKIVQYSNHYQAVFKQVEAQRQAYEQQRQALTVEIDQLKGRADSLQSQLDTKQKALMALREQNIISYNAEVPVYNALVASYNNVVNTLKAKVAEHNQIVAAENALSTTASNLTQKLDSNYQNR